MPGIMRPAIFLFLFLIAAMATAANLRFDPPNPTSRTPITAHVVGNFSGCSPKAERHGPILGITLENCRLNAPPPAVDVTADLGVVPAGVYDVVVGYQGIAIAVGLSTLVVRDAAPPFEVTPNVGIGGDEITISGKDVLICAGGPSPLVCGGNAQFDGIAATVKGIVNGQLIVIAPTHQAGPVDITIQKGGDVLRATASFYYVPSDQPPDAAFYEPVLIPVAFSGPGAFGSQWRTDIALRNENDFSLLIAGETPFSRPGAHSTMTPDANRPNGILAYLPRQGSSNVHFGVLVRDLSRQAEVLGTEVPVVREKDFFDRPLELLNVPADPRFRVALRVYDLGTPGGIHIRIQPLSGDEMLVDTFVFPAGRNPAYAQISDFLAAYPRLAGKGPLRITVDAPIPGNPTLWAFASITNNETQHVTTISPQ